MQQENNAIVNNLVDEILLNETQKVSAARGEPDILDSDYDNNNLYQVFLKRPRKHLTGISVCLNTNRTIHMGFKIEMVQCV